MKNYFRLLFTITLCLAVTSCGGGDDEASNNENTASSAFDALQALLLPKAPEGPLTITEARKKPTPGTKIIVSGKVMGNKNPIIQSRALLTLGDPDRLDSCDLIPGDDCPTHRGPVPRVQICPNIIYRVSKNKRGHNYTKEGTTIKDKHPESKPNHLWP